MKYLVLFLIVLGSCTSNNNKPTQYLESNVGKAYEDIATQEKNVSDATIDSIVKAKTAEAVKNYKPDTEAAYEKIHVVFEGNPEKAQVKPILEYVMKTYGLTTINNDEILKVANMLFVLKKNSKVGVTEMDILKHIYQHGNNKYTLAQQAAISSTILENSKIGVFVKHQNVVAPTLYGF